MMDARRHKHLKLDQRKIDFAKRYFGVRSEQEAIDRALGLLMEEERLLEALGKLPEEQQTALKMRYLENLPSKDIATHLGKSDAAVRVMLTRSIKKLQSILGEESVGG